MEQEDDAARTITEPSARWYPLPIGSHHVTVEPGT